MSENGQETLPRGWVESELGACATLITKGSTPTSYGHEYKPSGIAFIRVENLSDGYINRDSLSAFIDEAADETLKRSRLQTGDVLFSIAGTIGRTALVREVDLPANTNQALAIIRGMNGIFLSSFLRLVLSSSFAQRQAQGEARGGAMENISLSDVRALRLPIPPLPEQHRIVAEIEKQFTRLDAGVAALERARANLKRYRASVLKAACEGRLVPTEAESARAEGRDYEPADRLLAHILKERRAKWEADQLAKLQAQGKMSKDHKWKEKYQEPPGPDTTDLPELPEGWRWASPEQLSASDDYALAIGPFGSNLKVSDYTKDGIPLVFVRNIRTQTFGGNSTSYISKEKAEELRPHWVSSGDILITKMGDPPGDACLYPSGQSTAVITADCIKFRPCNILSFPVYFVFAINSQVVRPQILAITKGVAQLKVSLGRFKTIAFPLPPLAEQRRIVSELERRLSVINELESVVTANLKRAERLRQSILKRAFEGKLVPQDPKDEPASVLLERIRAERTRREMVGATGRSPLQTSSKKRNSRVSNTQAELSR